ncbi:unnamed protein product (macronuclear) [Paramecium tetraurelia]|uniref:Ubiquitin-like protease family profile domain-containing protein n=1 Tax=Paramecium tetraurelia TaxID=5888 RepID=A0BI95_PARTE|nr:uncharacterized protein GSPATT00004634001 [Paramecium tetraurelia]CAK58262.1 unnamed protein product [Paramecium tetraurelia]|eukprot:XP_001425660.1 hypothetical protein (macronuclear) [Paramecium tetraurelia strain d4-2]
MFKQELNPSKIEYQQFNFLQHVSWAFEQNEGTYVFDSHQLNQTQTKLFTTVIQDDQIKHLTWLFRKCHNESELQKQNAAFIDLQRMIIHIFKFLLLFVSNKMDDTKLRTLMNSISILNENNILQIYLPDPDPDILHQKYSRDSILRQGDDQEKNFEVILNIWFELKDETIKDIILPQSDFQFLQDLQRLNACLNMNQSSKIAAKNKDREKEKKRKMELEKEKQAQKMFQSQLRKEQLHSMKMVKIAYKEGSQSLFLQPNGNIVKGKVWFPYNSPHLCPLWLSSKFEILSSYFNNNLNADLRKYCGLVSYSGPVNDYFEPHTYDFDNETEGIMKTLSDETTYKGGFKNGLIDGTNRVYNNASTLLYYGGYKIGQKHGEGYSLEYYSQQNQPTYMKGQYESNLKQGLFVNHILVDGSKREKQFQKQGSIQEYYKNGIKHDRLPADIQQYKASQNPSCYLLNFNEYGINNFQLASLRPGGWINSSVIDILLKQLLFLVNNSNLPSQNTGIQNMKTCFINCSQFQDIFGSMVTKGEKINHKIFDEMNDLHQSYLMKDKLNGENQFVQNFRIVFYFNLDRSHFLSAVFENERLYLIDSLRDNRKAVVHQITLFLQYFGFKVQEQNENFRISQQQNSFDCGAYTIFYVSQIIKHQHLTIEQMINKNCFEISQSQINYLRYLIYLNLIGDGASIIQL